MGVRNKDLYKFIETNYIRSDKPLTQQQIADAFGMSLGAIKNFMFRHNLNKKSYYEKLRLKVNELYNKGLSVKQIAKLLEVTDSYIYVVLNKDYKELKEIK